MKEWALSLRSAHKLSQELLGSMARKAGKIYGTEREKSSAMINSNSSGNTAAANVSDSSGSTSASGALNNNPNSVKNTNGSN